MLSGNGFGGGKGINAGNRRSRTRLIGAAVMAAMGSSGMLTQQAKAGNDLWVGNTSVNWATANNWNPTSGPVSGDSLTFNAAGSSGLNLIDNLMTPGSYQISGITFSSTAAAFNISAGVIYDGFTLTGPITDNSASNTETVNDNITLGATPTITVASGGTLNLGGVVSGGFGITTSGAGTVNLTGTDIYTGATTVSQGTLGVYGTIIAPASTITVANVLSQTATMKVNAGAYVNGLNLLVGSANASAGAVYQSGGLVSLVQGAGTTDLALGAIGGGYGYYKLTGGTLLTNEMDIGGATGSNTGVMDVLGGTINDTGWIVIQRGSGGAGVLNVNGATVYAGTLNGGGSLAMLWGGGSAQLSITNGAIIGPNNSNGASGYLLNLSATGGVSGTSVVNLNSGGLLQVSGVVGNSTVATDLLNFNGGTLKFAGQNAGANGSFLLAAADLSAYIYGGGATIDSNGGAITITKQLLAPTGDGVSAVSTSGLTTTGYVGAPVVTITGGTGFGATGVATINSSGVLTGITITNPGTGYLGTDNLTVTLSGGGVASSNETIAPTFVANVNTGGLTLNGNGQITIGTTGTDQYTGNTTVNGGKLTLDFNQSTITSNIISSSSSLVLNGGNLLINGKASGVDSQTFNGTSLTDGGAIVTMTPGTSGTILLNLGAITRTAPATLSLTQPTVGTVSATNGYVTSTSNNTAGILGGWATVNAASNAADWATNNGTDIIALPAASYTALNASGGTTTTNFSTTTATNTLTGNLVANSLKLGTGVTSLALGTNTLTFSGASGGLLIAGTAAATISGTAGSAVIGGGSGNEFIIQDWSSGAITISAPIMGASDTGRLTKAGTGALTISSTNTYTGGTTIIGGTVTLASNTALGTGPIEINPNGIVDVGNTTGIVLNSGIDIPNAITVDVSTFNTGTSGTITATAGTAEIDGNITLKGAVSPGGLFNAPTTAGQYLILTGNLISTDAPDNSSFVAAGATYTGIDAIVVRSGNIRIYNPGGLSSYYRFDIRAGVLQDGGPNGVATNASVDIGANAVASSFDLNGNNQTLVGISNTNNQTVSRTVTNTNASSPSILTLTPLAVGQINSNLNSSGIVFTDSSASFPLSIVLNGDPTGTQTFSSAVSTYHGSTTLTSSTLSIPALANGGVASSIGESSNAASNLVFGGGTLLYTGASTSTDRSFTVNANTTANINVSSSSAVVNFSSAGTLAATTNGALNKLGAGTLVFSGTQTYTGATTISAGTFELSPTGSLAGSVVAPTGSTFVAGGTTAGATAIGAGATVVPGASNFSSATLPTLPTVTLGGTGIYNTGPLSIQKTSVVDFAFGSGSNAQFNVNGALNLYGGALDFTNSGAATAFSTAGGPYTLFTYSGAFTGSINNFTIADAQAGKAYAFVNTGTQIQLNITNSTSGTWTNGTTDELWTDGGNWQNSSIPNAVSSTANFGSGLANSDGNVNLASTNETVGFLNFDNTSTPGNVSFTIGASGSGILILDNGTAASPGITVTAGTHTISAPLRLNAPLAGSTTISTGGGSSLTLSGAISNGSNGAQTVSFAGPGTVILAEPSSTITTSNITGGFLQVGAGGTAGTLGTSSVAISSGAALSFDLTSASTVVTNNISGASGSVNQFGSGIVTLTPSSTNTFGTTAGGLNISSGTIQAGNATGLPTGVLVTMSGGTLDLNTFSSSVALQNSSGGTITDNTGTAGTTTLTNTWAGALQTYSGNIANGGSGRVLAFNQSGTGVTALAGNNTYSGGTQQSAGTLEGASNNAFGTGVITMSGGAVSLKIANGVTLPNHIVLNAANPGVGLGAITTVTATDNATYSGEIDVDAATSSGGFIAGPGTSGLLTFTGPIIVGGATPPANIVVRSGFVQLADTTGNSSYPLMIVDTTGLSLGHDNGIATSTVLQMSNVGNPGNGTIDLNGYNQTLAGITQVGGVGIIQDTNGSAANTGPGTGPENSSVLTVNTSATAFPDSAPDVYAGNINSYVQLIKTGAGTLSLTNASTTANNSYFGGTIIEQGVLAVAVLDGSGASNLGQSFIGPSDLTFASPGGTLRYTGLTSSTNRSFQINDGVTATIDVSTSGAVLTDSGNASVDGSESSSPASFNKGAGVGTLILTGSLPYHGNTGVAGGTLLVTGNTGTPGSGTINILAGGTLGGTGTVSGSLNHIAGTIVGGASATVPTSGTLTFTDPLTLNGGIDLNNIAASSMSTSGVNQQGYITASGGLAFGATPEVVSIQVTGALATGTYVYNLFDYSGSLSGTQNLSYISNLGRATFATNLSTAGEVNVTIVTSGAANLYWNSTSSSAWDVHTNTNASSGTASWYNAGSNLATDKFYQGDNVTFADSGTAAGSGHLGSPLQSTINISSGVTVTPGSITVTANSTNYTINGPGSIGGTGALTLSGTSTLTLGGSNSYSGGTNINGGILALANANSIGTIGTISFGGGTLQYSSSNAVDYSSQFSTASNQPIIIDTNNQNVTFASNLTSSNGTLTKLGLGTLTLSGSNSYNGATTITAGTLYITAQANVGGGGPIVFNGGVLGSGGITLSNNLVVNSPGGSLTNTGNAFFTGTLVGSGTLVSSGSAADVFTGSGFTAGNPSPTASFTGTIVSQYQVNITDQSASPYANYNASTASGNNFIFGSGTYQPSGPVQLGSLTGVAGSTVRDGNTAGIGPVTWQIGALGTSTVFAGNLIDNSGGTVANTSALNKVGGGNLTMSGANTYSGGTTVTAGTLTMASATAYPANSPLTIATGATFNISNHTPNATYVPQMSSLSNSGTIDVTNNAFLVVGGSVSTITAETQIGYHNGTWNGTNASSGVITSSLAASDTTHLTAVGVATGLTSFEGLTVPSTDVLVKYTYYGDANLSGTVDGSDYSIIDNTYELEKTSGNISGWYNGDFNYDNVVNGSDYTLIDNAFNSQGANLAAEVASPTAEIAGGSGASAVPEPTSLALLGAGALGLLGRRRRRISRRI